MTLIVPRTLQGHDTDPHMDGRHALTHTRLSSLLLVKTDAQEHFMNLCNSHMAGKAAWQATSPSPRAPEPHSPTVAALTCAHPANTSLENGSSWRRPLRGECKPRALWITQVT